MVLYLVYLTFLIPDRENAAAHLGSKMKQHQSNGISQSLAHHAQKKFSMPNESFHTGQRSFGDISNKIGRVNVSSHGSAVKKKQSNAIVNESLPKLSLHAEKEQLAEPEFFPDINDTEDYSDILPPPLQLSDKHISQLVHFWEICRRPELNSLDPSEMPKSPPKSLPLMSTVKDKIPIHLEPVIEEVYDVPLPPWE